MSEREVFMAALQKESPAERRAYLDAACRGDATLRQGVEALLEVHERAGSFLAFPAMGHATTLQQPLSEGPGTVIGPYKLLEQIGEGGFGVVFMAEQQQPVRRKVALKVLKPGMDSRQVIARFEAERQALALMDHPNIARVLDAGQTAAGRPYFIMDLVNGLPITEFCDRSRLSPRERLELFVSVCHAVQHAHQKGIIHRDLKPSNVLVTLQDGAPLVKVIDFGIAKALGQQLTDKTLFTAFAQLIGTPLYMSPEQAALSNVDVDTRSDIYSLGVLLYELLTGKTPFDQERLSKAGYDEMRRIIREEEPPTPSRRLRTEEGAGRKKDIKQRAHRFSALLPAPSSVQELDWIAMKAMEKERSRRYETAGALARDVQRYLQGEPVAACPPSPWYRFRKLAARHRTVFVAAALAGLALVAGTAVSVWQAVRATQAADAERQALVDLGEEQKATQRELGRAQEAEVKATRELFDALVAQARANRLSRRMGQRFGTLEILRRAISFARQLQLRAERFLEMRNEAIAALALPDLRLARQWPAVPHSEVSFDSTLARYASVDYGGRVDLRQAGDGRVIHHVAELGPGNERWPICAPDSSHVMIIDLDAGRVRVWRVTDAETVQVLNEPGSRTACFSPDSRHVALQQADGTIGIYDLATRKRGRQLPALPPVYRLAFHPTGTKLAIGCWNFAQVCDLESGKVLWKKSPVPVANTGYWPCVAWQPPQGAILALGEYDAISLWDVTNDKPVGKLDGISGGGIGFSFNASGTLLASTGWSGIVRLWDPLTSRELFRTHQRSLAAQFSVDGRFLAVHDDSLGARIFEIAGASEYHTLVVRPQAGKRPYALPAISPDGRMLCAGAKGGVVIWDFPGGKELAFLEESPWNLAAWDRAPESSPAAGRKEARLLTRGVNGTLLRTIRFDSVLGGVQVGPAQQLPVPPSNTWFSQSRDGQVLAAAQSTGAVVWHRSQGDRLITLGPQPDVRGVAVSPDGRWVATGSHSPPGGARVWEARTGTLVRDLPTAGVYCYPVFSPDGKYLLSGSASEHLVRRWQVGTWAEARFAEPFKGQIPTFSADGNWLVIETGAGIARLADASTGKEYARLEDPDQHRSKGYAFSPDGTRLVSATEDGYCVHVWDLHAIRRQLADLGLDW
jgi:serine/threonine protein kinase/WD40 repeat protein